MSAMYRLIVTTELERLDGDGSIDWRGSNKVDTVADLPSLLTLVGGDEIAVAVRGMAYRIVAQESERQAENDKRGIHG